MNYFYARAILDIMVKKIERIQAINLRKKGMGFNEINLQVKVSKDTLGRWLKDYPLTQKQIETIHESRIERYIETMRLKREKRLHLVHKSLINTFPKLTKRELLIAGLFLYWGEGNKRINGPVSISNTNPFLVKFFIRWLKVSYGIKNDKLKAYLQLYSNMDVKKEINFWSEFLQIPKDQFCRPYIKESDSNSITHANEYQHGTCNVSVNNVRLKEIVITSIQIVSNNFIQRNIEE